MTNTPGKALSSLSEFFELFRLVMSERSGCLILVATNLYDQQPVFR